nr:832_t:CDS:2 [Entrophospora candida]
MCENDNDLEAKMDSVGEFKPTESEVGIESRNDYEEEVQKIDKGKQDVEHMNSNNDCGSSSSSNGTNTNKKLHQS